MIDVTKSVCSLFIPVIGELEPISDQKVAQDLNWIFEQINEIRSHWTSDSNAWESFQVTI